MKTPTLDHVYEVLQQFMLHDTASYAVPGCWIDAQEQRTFPSGCSYILHQIDRIRTIKPVQTRSKLLYNAYVRHITSYAHGHSDDSQSCWRSTGTFLKLLALAPYLHSIGVTQLVLLPIFATGTHGRKGTLGSPYAVRNPYAVNDELADGIPGLSAVEQARAMVEAMHVLGIDVVVEVVLRTASIDADAVSMHPEWFYWVRESDLLQHKFQPPTFEQEELRTIKAMVAHNQRFQLPEPHADYRDMFANTPKYVWQDADGWLGIGADGERLRIPSAFADWPPDDMQPLWSDVTYYKLHRHPDLCYMAYNTIRMFDERLNHQEYPQYDLWNELSNIIPHYQHMLGIDGAMIDMGHALPHELRYRILDRARENDAEFLIYEESFDVDTTIAQQGVNAVMGYLPHASRNLQTLRDFTLRCSRHGLPMNYFGAVDSHNTPRIASTYGHHLAAAVWTYISFLPKSLPYIVAGFELSEQHPINTGLDFTVTEQEHYVERGLPLFDDVPLSWDRDSDVMAILRERRDAGLCASVMGLLRDDDQVILLDHVSQGCIAFLRKPHKERQVLLVGLNMSATTGYIRLPRRSISDVTVGANVEYTENEIVISVPAERCCVLSALLRSKSQQL